MPSRYADKVVDEWLKLGDIIDSSKALILGKLESLGRSYCSDEFKREIKTDEERATLFMAEVLPFAVGIIHWAEPQNILTALQNAGSEAGPGTDPAGLVAAATLLYLLEKGHDEARQQRDRAGAEEEDELQERVECWRVLLDLTKGVGEAQPGSQGSRK